MFCIANKLPDNTKIILASGSPRRAEILKQLGFSFIQQTPKNFDESAYQKPFEDLPCTEFVN